MANLTVGIHENVTFDLKTSEVNGQPVLNVVLTQVGEEDTDFDFETADTKGAESESTQITSWALKTQGFDESGNKVDVRSPKLIMADYKNKTAYLTAILELFTDKNNLSWSPFDGLDINTQSIKDNPKLLQDDDVLAVMTKNIYEQAVGFFKEYGDTEKKFRVALVRTSKKKNTPKLRDKALDKNVIAESMDVPVEESKVGFTDYEIKQKLNDPTPAESDTDGKDTSIDDTFGSQVKDPAGVPSNL